MGRRKEVGRFDSRQELEAFILSEYRNTKRTIAQIAGHARVTYNVARTIISQAPKPEPLPLPKPVRPKEPVPCDCLNWCGDDPWLAKGWATPCPEVCAKREAERKTKELSWMKLSFGPIAFDLA